MTRVGTGSMVRRVAYRPMTTAAKRALFVLATLAFLVLGPAVVLYAWGYRYNFREQRVDVTGILYVKAYPRRANVLLDGQLRYETTPAQLTGLQPGSYRVTVEREGSWPWTKVLPVTAQRVTFAEDVVLFRREPVQLAIASGTVADLSSSPNGEMVASVSPATSSPSYVLEVRDSRTGTLVTRQALAPSLAPYQLLWTNSSRRLAVIGARQALAIAVGNAQNPVLVAAPATPWLQLQWDRASDNALVAIGPGGTQRYDLGTRRWTSLNRTPLVGLRQSAEGDIAAYATGTQLYLAPWPEAAGSWRVTLATGTASTQLAEVAGSGSLMLWRRGSDAWLVDTDLPEPSVLRSWDDATQASWSPAGPTLAVARRDDVDVIRWVESVPTSSSFSLPLPNMRTSWYPGGTHLYLSAPGNLLVAELDPRDQRNVHTLLATSAFDGLAVPTSDSAALYWALRGNASTTGLYRATVQ